jgi:predicted glutamine amidotransferase
MCGIAGFSLTPTSKVKTRQLANALLTAIEDRGYMASGFAYQVDSHMGYHKDATPGSMLSLKSLPKDARHVILHTRLATHGAVTDNRNNHPVMSPSENIALVHNGVIYNHKQVRLKIDGDLPDVDTSVIPAVIEQLGVDSLDVLDGDAAIAWFDRKQHNTLHLARYQHSPLVMCQIEDGSFIFASTEQLLWKVLIQLELMPTWMETAKELDYFTIRDGVVLSSTTLPAPKVTDTYYDYGYYRHQTSGAKGSTSSSSPYGSGYSSYGDTYYEGYGWTDWDDEWEGYYSPNDTRSSCAVPSNHQYDTEEYFDFNSFKERRAKWYTKLEREGEAEPYTLYYFETESKMWKDELYLLADAHGVTILDYGSVRRDGQLVPSTDDIF